MDLRIPIRIKNKLKIYKCLSLVVLKVKTMDVNWTDITISHMANVPRLVNTKSSGNNQNQENRFVLMEELINGNVGKFTPL